MYNLPFGPIVDGIIVPNLPHGPLFENAFAHIDAIFGVVESETLHMFTEALGKYHQNRLMATFSRFYFQPPSA